DLAAFKPTFLLAVPRVFEKVYNGAEAKAIAGGRGKIFAAATQTAIDFSKAQSAGKVPLILKAKHTLFDKLVYGKLREAMGGQIGWAVSGGAALGARLAHLLRGIGVTVLEGCGLTETAAPGRVSLTWPVHPGAERVLAATGSPHTPEATADSLRDGWSRTGDIGSLDADGSLTITGRSKEVLVTAGGKNVSPAPLEDVLRSHPLVSQCVVIGDQRP